jgi:hypothetical protein
MRKRVGESTGTMLGGRKKKRALEERGAERRVRFRVRRGEGRGREQARTYKGRVKRRVRFGVLRGG